MQRTLSIEQIEAFYHSEFVDDQVRDFMELTRETPDRSLVVDVGGGCGFFAKKLSEKAALKVCVIDSDTKSIDTCFAAGIDARLDDALETRPASISSSTTSWAAPRQRRSISRNRRSWFGEIR